MCNVDNVSAPSISLVLSPGERNRQFSAGNIQGTSTVPAIAFGFEIGTIDPFTPKLKKYILPTFFRLS